MPPPRRNARPSGAAEDRLSELLAPKGPKSIDPVLKIVPGSSYPVLTEEDGCWGDDYNAARQLFRRAALPLRPVIFDALTLRNPDNTPLLDENGLPLTIDFVVFGNATNPTKVFLCESGVHGPEGFAGSAGQVAFLRSLAAKTGLKVASPPSAEGSDPPLFESDTCYIFVHGVNPWGMAHGRRWNENNVDLNRNQFVRAAFSSAARRSQGSPYAARGTHPAFKRLGRLLQERTGLPPFLDTILFFVVAAILLAIVGFKGMRQAIVGGQDSFPEAPFFGGVRLEAAPRALWDRVLTLFRSFSAPPKLVAQLDLHTALGKRGDGFALTDTPGEYTYWKKAIDATAAIIGPHITIQPPGGSDTYETLGASRTAFREALVTLADERAKPGMGASGFSMGTSYAAAAAQNTDGRARARAVVGASETGDSVDLIDADGYAVLPGGERFTSVTIEIGTYPNIAMLRRIRRETGEWRHEKRIAERKGKLSEPFFLPPDHPARLGMVDAFRPADKAWEVSAERVFAVAIAECVRNVNAANLK